MPPGEKAGWKTDSSTPPASFVASPQRPSARIRIGLVGFRDRKDEYVTRLFDLSEDIDESYGRLVEFTAGGGGDTPESVNEALAVAVGRIQWTPGS